MDTSEAIQKLREKVNSTSLRSLQVPTYLLAWLFILLDQKSEESGEQ